MMINNSTGSLRRSYRFLMLISALSFSSAFALESKATQQIMRFYRSDTAGTTWVLTVDQQPVTKVLALIGAQTDIHLHYAGLAEQTVSANCVGETVKQILQCLLGEQSNVVYRYRTAGNNEMPVEIWVLKIDTSADMPNSNLTSNDRLKNEETLGKSIDNVNVEALLQRLNQPKEKSQTIALLANNANPADMKMRNVFKQALRDKNPEVRAQAVFALAKQQGPAAYADLKSVLHDANPEVRLMVVDSLDQDQALLSEAANDVDPAVQQLALAKLAALNETSK